MDVLVASTRGGSLALGRDKEVGTVEKGKLADLVIVDGDPLDDITQIDEWVDLEVLTGLHQRTQDGGPMRRRFAPREQPVFTTKHDGPQC